MEGSVSCGVPQGSVLGPLLFGLFINDLPLHITNPDVVSDLFADDGSLHTSARYVEHISASLQHALSDVLKWCTAQRMVIHPQKTKSMIITSQQKHQLKSLTLDLYLGSHSIEQVNSHRLLGVIIDSKLKWQLHINFVCKRVSQNLYLLNKLKHFVDADAQKLFFHAHCLSHINYVSSAWCGASTNHKNDLILCTDEELK